MKTRKKQKQLIQMEIYILLWLQDFPFIDKLEKPFSNSADAVYALNNMRSEIFDAIERRSRVIGYPVEAIEEENRGFERWDDLLQEGAITQQLYNYSMTSPDLLCIMHWNTTDQVFECACEKLGCKFHR
jgi:hypothetical protein